MQGSATVTPKVVGISLPTQRGIGYDKSVSLTGCGGLADVQLLSFSLQRSTATQLLVDAAISIHNPSTFSIDPIGRLSFDLYYDGFKQGSLHSLQDDVRLQNGENVMNFTGVFAPEDLSRLDLTNELVARYLTGQDVQITAAAAAEASSIPLYNRAMQGLRMNTTLAPLANGSLITSLQITAGVLTPSRTDNTVAMDLQLQFTHNSPLGLQGEMELFSMDMDAEAAFLNTTVDANGRTATVVLPVGRLFMPGGSTPLVKAAGFNSYSAHIAAVLQLNDETANFQEFVRAFVQTEGDVGLHLTGTASVAASYLYGNLSVSGVPLDNTLFMQGAGGLTRTQELTMRVHDNRQHCSDHPDDQLCGVMLEMTASMVNPSRLTLNLSASWFDLLWHGARLGSLQMDNLFVAPGYNVIGGSGFLDPAQQDLATVSTFISEHIDGRNHSVKIRGLAAPPSSTVAESNAFTSAHDLLLAAVQVALAGAVLAGGRLREPQVDPVRVPAG